MCPINFKAVEQEKPALGRLKGKVALVTGVGRARSIGTSIAKLYAREGAIVCCTDVVPSFQEHVDAINAAGGKAFGYQADLTKYDQVETMVNDIIVKHGRIDILANSAGKSVPPRPSFTDMTLDYWDMVMERNLTTCVYCCKAVVPHMVKQNYGKIVNLGSTTGQITVYRYCAAYAASKGAVSAFTRALALEVGEFDITVNTIQPGDIDTGDVAWKPGDPQRDLSLYAKSLAASIARPVRSEEVAELALFLASDESRIITGADYLIDGGLTTVEGMATGGPQ